MKTQRKLIVAMSLCAAVVVPGLSFGALIDNGGYTTDDVSGLEWLDLNFTSSLSYNQAVIDNPGWRHATASEVESLFSQVFPSYSTVNGDKFMDAYSPSDELWMNAEYFQGLFGLTLSSGSWDKSYGIYKDGEKLLLAGAYLSQSDVFPDNNLARVFLSYGSGIPSADTLDPYNNYSPFLVRSSVVPLPNAVWLFGSGLIGLIGVARKKSA